MRGAVPIALGLAWGLLACATAAQARDRTVVELFTSQGCEECWRANMVVADLARQPELLVLTFPVDYWDHLGWRDTFAKPAFTTRQTRYRKTLRLRALQTPQVIVDGVEHVPGLDRPQLVAMLRAHRREAPQPADVTITWEGRRALVSNGRFPAGGADVWLVRYDPRPLNVSVTSGENRGRTVPHRNVVRELVRLGAWSGRGRSYTLPPPRIGGLRQAILVQSVRDGRVLANDAER